jgi:hypothetical protein
MYNYVSFDDKNNNKACFIIVASFSFLLGFLVNNKINMLLIDRNYTKC